MDWINVKDRLPCIFEFVLVCTTTKKVINSISIARYDGVQWEFMAEEDEIDQYGKIIGSAVSGDMFWEMSNLNITHWMPLPKPPKDK